jgi:hypothetical protein
MKDVIREFAKDSDLDWHVHWNDDESNRLERFADLIIKECIALVDNAVVHRVPASEYVSLIKEHFEGGSST